MAKATRVFDLVLFGASGFTGKLTALYLKENAPSTLRWAVAGRNVAKVAKALDIDVNSTSPPILHVDAMDHATVDAMAKQTRVVLSTAGPFARFGTSVVDACVKHSTDYVDITGEVLWVKAMIDKHHETAKARGVKIVSCSGFDSIPSDLGAYAMVQEVRRKFGEETSSVTTCVSISSGKEGSKVLASGGTLASACDTVALPTSEKVKLRDELLLNPADQKSAGLRRRNKTTILPRWDTDNRRWASYWVMAAVNTKVTRRSHALYAQKGEGYGRDFSYDEYMGSSRNRYLGWIPGFVTLICFGLFGILLSFGCGRRLASRFLPQGTGPDKKARDSAITKLRYTATSESGKKLRGTLLYLGDPGYKMTSMMLAECALGLALERERMPDNSGVISPAFAFGSVTLERFQKAGVKFTFDDGASTSPKKRTRKA